MKVMRPLPKGFVPSADRTFTVPYSGTMNSSQYQDAWIPPWQRGLDILSPSPTFASNIDQDHRFIRMAPKSSADVLDYSIDFGEVLSDTGDSISSITANDLSAAQSPFDVCVLYGGVYDNTIASIIIASGIPSSLQEIDIQIQTTQGRVLNKQLRIWINTLTPATASPSLIPSLPLDATLDGLCFITRQSPLDSPLLSNGGVITTTDEDVVPTGTISNGGVIASHPM